MCLGPGEQSAVRNASLSQRWRLGRNDVGETGGPSHPIIPDWVPRNGVLWVPLRQFKCPHVDNGCIGMLVEDGARVQKGDSFVALCQDVRHFLSKVSVFYRSEVTVGLSGKYTEEGHVCVGDAVAPPTVQRL